MKSLGPSIQRLRLLATNPLWTLDTTGCSSSNSPGIQKTDERVYATEVVCKAAPARYVASLSEAPEYGFWSFVNNRWIPVDLPAHGEGDASATGLQGGKS
jgi:hypothetical protein